MPTLTIPVTDAQATRIQEAFRTIINPETGDLPTMANIRAWIVQQIRNKVIDHEFSQARTVALSQASENVEAMLDAEGWNAI